MIRTITPKKLQLINDWELIPKQDREKEIDYLISEGQMVMLERINSLIDLKPNQLNILALEIK